MRVKLSGSTKTKEFTDFLLSIGNGTIEGGEIPEEMMTKDNTIEELTDFVFPKLDKQHKDPNW